MTKQEKKEKKEKVVDAAKIFPGMPLKKFEDVTRNLFEINDGDGSGTLNFSDFKAFTIDLEREAGLPEVDINKLKTQGTYRTWMAIFALYDINGDGEITWEEAWNFLKMNAPPLTDE